MLNEYDSVRAIRNLSNKVFVGCTGVVVMVYGKGKENLAYYEIEFFDKEYNTIDLLTVSDNDIELLETFE